MAAKIIRLYHAKETEPHCWVVAYQRATVGSGLTVPIPFYKTEQQAEKAARTYADDPSIEAIYIERILIEEP